MELLKFKLFFPSTAFCTCENCVCGFGMNTRFFSYLLSSLITSSLHPTHSMLLTVSCQVWRVLLLFKVLSIGVTWER